MTLKKLSPSNIWLTNHKRSNMHWCRLSFCYNIFHWPISSYLHALSTLYKCNLFLLKNKTYTYNWAWDVFLFGPTIISLILFSSIELGTKIPLKPQIISLNHNFIILYYKTHHCNHMDYNPIIFFSPFVISKEKLS